MIDIHCHILPGLDDGPKDVEASISLARFAAADGTHTIVATPHVREDYPFDLALIPERARLLNDHLAAASVPVRVEQGAEVSVSMLTALDDATIASICLGSSSSVLVESPYQQATDLLEQALFDIQLRGFRAVLAHPERSPSFMSDPDRLAALVERGVLCSVTSASMAGRFGAHGSALLTASLRAWARARRGIGRARRGAALPGPERGLHASRPRCP